MSLNFGPYQSFLRLATDAPMAPRPECGLSPEELHEAVQQDVGLNWGVVWNHLLRRWAIYRFDRRAPQPYHELCGPDGELLPFSREAVWEVRRRLAITENFKRVQAINHQARRDAAAMQDAQLHEHFEGAIREARETSRLHGCVSVPRSYRKPNRKLSA